MKHYSIRWLLLGATILFCTPACINDIHFLDGTKSKLWSLKDPKQLLFLEILRLDTAENIVAGRMTAPLISDTGLDTLRLEDGRFDLHYSPR